MESVKPIRLRLSEKLSDVAYFNRFFDDRTRDEVATQLRELRERNGLSQAKFANAAGMKQSAVSRIEQSDYSGWTFKTLLRAAHALRARLKIEFVPAERVIEEYRYRESVEEAAILAMQSIDRFRIGKSTQGIYQIGLKGDGPVFEIANAQSLVVAHEQTNTAIGVAHGQ